jgi:hypothetical protein
MATKNQFFRLGKFSIRVGLEIRFWEHKWLGTTTLRDQYPALYNIIRHKGDTIAKVMASSPPDVTFRTASGRLERLTSMLASVHFQDGHDVFL